MLAKALSVALLALALVTGGLAGAPASALPAPQEKYESQARTKTDQARQSAGLVTLKKNDCVQRFAVRQATKMAQQQRMFHQDLGPILTACELSMVGENVASGYPSGKTLVVGWLRSPGHRANILNQRYRILGLAARKSSDGRWYAAQVFGRRL